MRTRKRSIASLMWIVFFAAVGLALVRAGPDSGGLVHLWLWLVIGSQAALWLWFVVVPQQSLKLARGIVGRQRRLLEWVVSTPCVPGVKVHARYLLAANYQSAMRCSEAEELYRLILKHNHGNLEAGFESFVRQRLADSVEALGRRKEADLERERAEEILAGADTTILKYQAQGKLFDREYRYDEAIAAYEKALSTYPTPNKAIATTLMMQLALSSNNAGRPRDTVRWAEAVIALDPRSPVGEIARRMAALGHTALGHADDAERHLRAAIARASSPTKRAESLALLAGCVMRRGELDQAERMAREAEALFPGKQRLPWKIIGHVEKIRGRLEEAIQALEHSDSVSISHIPAQNRQVSAVMQRDLATLHAELGRGDIALSLICEAEIELAGDRKQEMILDAAAALVHAFRHERDLARNRMASACEGRAELTDDRSTQQAVLVLLGRAALLIDEPERAESFLKEYLKLEPEPVSYPFVYYHLAECRRRAGDDAGGHEFDTKAASGEFGSRWERLARQRLAGPCAEGS
jgi:tetratricopeptide (TPR) repeat protein